MRKENKSQCFAGFNCVYNYIRTYVWLGPLTDKPEARQNWSGRAQTAVTDHPQIPVYRYRGDPGRHCTPPMYLYQVESSPKGDVQNVSSLLPVSSVV